ncbi:MAG: NADP-dependent isocitrate dehydrogenase [Alphaproteobacteria bacterium]|nr:NADP-dependent isocitrate dehydrogenase [Alphaproteobacteria bacterium]
MTTPITVTYGDGIGPEIMKATLAVLKAAGADIAVEEIDVGEKVYLSGIATGIPDSAWDSLNKTKVFLKAPITTPVGEGYKSLNVTMRKRLGLFANVRPCVSYTPYVATKHPQLDVVVVRENEEDLYAGIEYQQSQDEVESIKLVTAQGCERIIRYAFGYARANGRQRVTCFHKANIMKQTDGLFLRLFREIAPEYPDIKADEMIIDIGTARLAASPEKFDVIVTLNLYGDIISDVAAELTGSVGLGASSNIGPNIAMFEAIHGSAPDIAGKDMANPSGLLLSSVMMLVHIGQPDVASAIHNAWLRTIEDGVHTGDLYKPELSTQKVGTQGFAQAVIARLGQKPQKFKPVSYRAGIRENIANITLKPRAAKTITLVGADIYVGSQGLSPAALAEKINHTVGGALKLQHISSRGVPVWPKGGDGVLLVDRFRCRFISEPSQAISYNDILAIQKNLSSLGLDIAKLETLRLMDGKPAYQG